MTALRTATREEVAELLDWAAAEGWNPGLDDAPAFFAADPQGFFVAVEDGRCVAGISVVNHSDSFAFLGLYIVRPDWRGRGLGLALWQHALRHAGARCIGLDGVPEQQANYARSGFVRTGRTVRYAGTVPAEPAPALPLARSDDLPALIALEAAASGVEKSTYMARWFTQSATRKTFVLRDGRRLSGCVTARACRSGAKIGPLIAPDMQSARALMASAATAFGPQIMIDVPESAAPLHTLCRTWGLTPGFETARMYLGTAPTPTLASPFYAVTTLELG